MDRRKFFTTAAGSAATLALTAQSGAKTKMAQKLSPEWGTTATSASGLGGVAIANGFKPTSEEDAQAALEAAWESGVRMYDTAPFYGFGLGERRFGHFLSTKPKENYTISTKVGRLLEPDSNPEGKLWKDVPKFSPKVDYSASATRRSIEDSLQRLGIESIDIAYIHDLSPDFFGDEWTDKFAEAEKGAMPELTKMREEGLIKGWGLGVNTLPPILKAIEVAEPNICLTACEYSLVHHENALQNLFPKAEARKIALVIGAPLNFGFLAGRDRYNYGDTIPDGMLEKRAAIMKVAANHKVDLRVAALQFCYAPKSVVSIIPGARDATQATENAAALDLNIPDDFWKELKEAKLIAEAAPTPLA